MSGCNPITYALLLKDLSFIKNTRIIDVRNANLGLAWEYLPSDSLLFDYVIDLHRTIYPDSEQPARQRLPEYNL